jgi:hypothetical protein
MSAAIHCREYPLAQYYTETDISAGGIFEGQIATLYDTSEGRYAEFHRTPMDSKLGKPARRIMLDTAICPGCDEPVDDDFWCPSCEGHCREREPADIIRSAVTHPDFAAAVCGVCGVKLTSDDATPCQPEHGACPIGSAL